MSKLVIVKLVTGEDVMGTEVKTWSGGGVKLGEPMLMCYTQDGGMFLDNFIIGSESKEADIGPHAIVTVVTASQKMIDFYMKSLYSRDNKGQEFTTFADSPEGTVN